MSIAIRQGIGSVIGQHRRGSLLENLEWEDSSDDGEEEKRALIAKSSLLNVAGRGSGDEEKFEEELAEIQSVTEYLVVFAKLSPTERLDPHCSQKPRMTPPPSKQLTSSTTSSS